MYGNSLCRKCLKPVGDSGNKVFCVEHLPGFYSNEFDKYVGRPTPQNASPVIRTPPPAFFQPPPVVKNLDSKRAKEAEANAYLQNRWIYAFPPRPESLVRLICFPYAGGSASVFKDWYHCALWGYNMLSGIKKLINESR